MATNDWQSGDYCTIGKPPKQPIRYQKSKSGLWHIIWFADDQGRGNYPICQSYNLDRPNFLKGEIVTELPEGAKLCKKCATHSKKGDRNAIHQGR